MMGHFSSSSDIPYSLQLRICSMHTWTVSFGFAFSSLSSSNQTMPQKSGIIVIVGVCHWADS